MMGFGMNLACEMRWLVSKRHGNDMKYKSIFMVSEG